MSSLAEDADLARENAELRAANQRLLRRNARLKEQEADLVEAVYQAAYDSAVTVGKASPVPRPSRDRRKGPEVALLHLTDFQLGKTTRTYSPDICVERIKLAVQKTIRITEVQRADHPVRSCGVMLGGDHVEGVTVFPGQAWEVETTAFEQIFRAADLIESTLLSLLEVFEDVTVWEVPGNHGRLGGKRGEMPRGDNLDRIVYRIVRDRMNQPRLTWHVNDSWYSIVEIGSYRAMLHHGDAIKSFGGNTPAFGILRRCTGWASGGILDQFDDVFMGHFHTPMVLTLPNGGTIRVTGSPESDNQYAAEFVAARGKPSQRLVFVDPERGRVTSDYVLWLDS